MNINFFKTMTKKTGFPTEAIMYLNACIEGILEKKKTAQFNAIIDLFYNSDFDINITKAKIEEFAVQADLSSYTVWLLMLIFATERARKIYMEKGAGDAVFWDTFKDLRYKSLECKELHNVYGISVPDWYPRFFRANIFKFGCMQYDIDQYVDVENKSYVYGDNVIQKGDFILGIHIPSSGESFDSAARLESYKKAYNFFKPQLNGKPMVCGCHSWLLYPDYSIVFPQGSNTRSFMDEFDIQTYIEQESFEDAWRVFGKNFNLNPKYLQEDTSLQREFKKHILSGGKYGIGCGVLLFDGEKILTKKESKVYETKD